MNDDELCEALKRARAAVETNGLRGVPGSTAESDENGVIVIRDPDGNPLMWLSRDAYDSLSQEADDIRKAVEGDADEDA